MSASEKPAIKKLSSVVMDLKFMKRSKEKFEKQEEDEERRHLYREQLAALHNSSNCIVMMPSFYDVQTYLPCRLSFGGMEPEIEKLNIVKLSGLYKVEIPPEVDPSTMKTDISDEKMVETFVDNRGKRRGRPIHNLGPQSKKSGGGDNRDFQKRGNVYPNGRFQGLKNEYKKSFHQEATDDIDNSKRDELDESQSTETGEDTKVKFQQKDCNNVTKFAQKRSQGAHKKFYGAPMGMSKNKKSDNFGNKNINTSDENLHSSDVDFQNNDRADHSKEENPYRNFNSMRGKFDDESPRGKFGSGNSRNPQRKFQKRRNNSEEKFQKKRRSFNNDVDQLGNDEFDSNIKSRTMNFLKDIRKEMIKETEIEDGEYDDDLHVKNKCKKQLKQEDKTNMECLDATVQMKDEDSHLKCRTMSFLKNIRKDMVESCEMEEGECEADDDMPDLSTTDSPNRFQKEKNKFKNKKKSFNNSTNFQKRKAGQMGKGKKFQKRKSGQMARDNSKIFQKSPKNSNDESVKFVKKRKSDSDGDSTIKKMKKMKEENFKS